MPPSKTLGPCTKDLLAVSLRTRKPRQPEDPTSQCRGLSWLRARQELLSAVQQFVALHGSASIVDRRRPCQSQALNNMCEADLVSKSLRSDKVTKSHDCKQQSRLGQARIVKASHLERSKHEWSLPRSRIPLALGTAYNWLCAPAHCKRRSDCQPSPQASGPREVTQQAAALRRMHTQRYVTVRGSTKAVQWTAPVANRGLHPCWTRWSASCLRA